MSNNQKYKKHYGCCKTCIIILLLLGSLLILFPIINEHYCLIKCGYQISQSEAKQYIRTMNRGQEVYFNQNNSFADSIEKLKLGINTETKSYTYSIQVNKDNCFSYAITKKRKLKSYAGGVFVIPTKSINSNFQDNTKTLISIICESLAINQKNINPPQLINNKPVCASETKEL